MSGRTDTTIELLRPFGLEEDEAKVYLVLLQNGVLSALGISRKLKMGRTKVYRILDKLIEKEVVIQRYNDKGLTFEACEPAKLTILLNKRQAELTALQTSLPQITRVLEQQTGMGKPGSKVLYYQGQKGLSQVNWNLLRAKGEFVSFEADTAEAYLAEDEAEELRRELVANKIRCRNIYNKTHIEAFTQVTELVKKWWEVKYIDPGEFMIQADVFIYNDVCAMCHYLGDGEIFCVEIYNQYLADMQKQLFEYVWARAKAMKILNDQGEAQVIGG